MMPIEFESGASNAERLQPFVTYSLIFHSQCEPNTCVAHDFLRLETAIRQAWCMNLAVINQFVRPFSALKI